MLGYPVSSGRGLLYNLAAMKAGLEAEMEAQTLKGEMQSKRARWNPEMIRELKEAGQWR